MAEAIVSGILKQLSSITVAKASEAWSLVRGVEKEVKRLEDSLKAIQLEIEDAEEKQYLDKRVKNWLDRFKDVCCDMEDVLDDWEAAIHQSQSDGVESSAFGCVPMWEVCPFVSCFSSGSQVVRRHDIATRIKEINEDLDQIVKGKDGFELIKREIKQPKRPESTSFVDVSELLGRDAVKEDIIRILLSEVSEESSRNIPTITLVGMGGIGKTALAQLIYNDPIIRTHFSKIIWVCASHPFDQSQIARAILEDLDPDSLKSLQNPPTLQSLLVKIQEKITAMKFLFVLDDVWTDRDQDWKPLKATFKFGMSGSWVLVTTRKGSVARQMGSPHVFNLELLSEDFCWLILAQNAFAGRSMIGGEFLEDIGREIAKKCKGLPLAAKTLGGLLQDKEEREEWLHVLNSELWKSDVAQEIFSPLLLSYYDLPSTTTIRQCLLYCAIFPKNYEIGKDELIQHWMAQGYLDDNVSGELKGEDYFKYLATRSFFQDFDKDSNGNVVFCKMHDMVHDFIQFLTENRFATARVQNLTLDLSTKKARHLRMVIRNFSSSGTEKLRSLVAVSHIFCKITPEVLQDLFSQSKHLRLLEFDSFYLDTKEIAPGIGNLIHLRYLSLISCFGLKILPEAVCELHNLQSLNLRNCRNLEKLPVGIWKLIKLRYLCIKGCHGLTYCPKGISKLTSLMRLAIKMTADNNDADKFSIGDLENLDLLRGNLCVELMGNAIDWDEVKRAKLHKKKHLKRMEIWICSPDIKEEEVLQALYLQSNLPVELFRYQNWLAAEVRCRPPSRRHVKRQICIDCLNLFN